MFKKSLLMMMLAGAMGVASSGYAYQFGKPMEVSLDGTSKKTVTLMRVQLSQSEKAGLAQRALIAPNSFFMTASSKLPAQVNLGMNGVPVLDQGRHGSCVTFADTAVVDAVLGKGDYISQFCNLELGNHFEKNGYTFSGWDGSYGPIVLQQMMEFGIVSKSVEQAQSCAGLRGYPIGVDANHGNEMTLSDFKLLSENLTNQMYWKHLYSNDQLFDGQTASKNTMQKVLLKVKRELTKGHRLTFGTFLIIPSGCSVGACASHNAKFDTWALTKNYDRPPYEVGGHEMVIFGYDDNATATEANGTVHKGLLMLRNSWSDQAGDQGNYYMTYDYFVKYANEVQSIVKL